MTKGSFYWHFKDKAALHAALLTTWKQRATLAIIDRLEHSHLTLVERLNQLIALPYPASARRSGSDRLVASEVVVTTSQPRPFHKSTKLRLGYLAALFRASGLGEREAAARIIRWVT